MKKAAESKGLKKKGSVTEAPQERKKRIYRVAAVSAVVLFFFNLATGVISYGVVAAVCFRPPVVASKFAAEWSYFRPGQTGYGPHAFGQYYCTEKDAENAGFAPSPW